MGCRNPFDGIVDNDVKDSWTMLGQEGLRNILNTHTIPSNCFEPPDRHVVGGFCLGIRKGKGGNVTMCHTFINRLSRTVLAIFACLSVFVFSTNAFAACSSSQIDVTGNGTNCQTVKFSLTTTSGTTAFDFRMTATGTFYVDCGDNGTLMQSGTTTGSTISGKAITRTETGQTRYICSWGSSAGAHTIRFGGTATGYYPSGTTSTYAAITFYYSSGGSQAKVASISGSLGSMFPVKNGVIPLFYNTFEDCTSLTSIPSTLFSGINTSSVTNMGNMFYGTFYGCTSLTSIPSNLFSGISISSATNTDGMFAGTFRGTGITSIPSNLFSTINTSSVTEIGGIFASTFRETGITSIPSNLFSTINTSSATRTGSMFFYTFSNCTSLTSIPANLFSTIDTRNATHTEMMFERTFSGCQNLNGYIPSTTFSDNIVNGKVNKTNMWSRTFAGTYLATECPAGTTEYNTHLKSYWDYYNGNTDTSGTYRVACESCGTLPANASWGSGTCNWTCNTGYHANTGNTACEANISGAITLDSKYYATSTTTTGTAVTTNAAPTTVYTKYNTGVYSNSGATTAITKLTTNPAYTGYTFGGFYTTKATGGTQVINSSGTFTAAAKTQISTTGGIATWYARWTAKSITCNAGQYLKASNATCTACTANSYCPGGTFTYNGSDQGITACVSPYTKSATSSDDANDCYLTTTATKYVATAGAGETACTANSYCPGGVTIYKGGSVSGRSTTGGITACASPYTKSAASSDDANDCYLTTTAKKYVATAGAGEVDCVAGTYCPGSVTIYKGGSVSGRSTTGGSTTCPANSYCVAKVSAATACSTTNANYTKSAAGSDDANDCYLTTTAKKYVATAGAGQVDCVAGTYCPGSATIYVGGSVSGRSTTGGSTTCPANSYCTAKVSAATACSTLGGGLYTKSAAGSDAATDCYITIAAKKYLPAQSSTAVSNCTAGNYCPGGNFYYSSTATNQGLTQCPANSYCTAGVSAATACSTTNANYTKSAAGSDDANDCYLTTTAKKYVATAGAGETDCTAGGYCPGSVTIYVGGSVSGRSTTGGRTTCPANSYCVAKVSAATACSTLGGKLYTKSAAGSDAATDCYITIAATKYLPAQSSTAVSNCTAGNYCPGGNFYYSSTATNQGLTQCPANSYCTAGVSAATACSTTNANYTKSAAGSDDANDCYLTTTAKKYVATAGAGQVDCVAGTYCPGSATIYVGGSVSGRSTTGGSTTCPANSYCVAKVSAATACSTLGGGLYTKSAAGSDAATDCYITIAAKKYLPAQSSTAVSNCTAGNYCPGGNFYYSSTATNQGLTQCPANSYCTAGVSAATACSTTNANYTKSAAGSDDANDCYLTTTAKKYVATAGAGQVDCVAGTYCQGSATIYVGGSVSGRSTTGGSTQCPANSYCVAGVSAATACSGLASGGYPKSNAGSTAATACYAEITLNKNGFSGSIANGTGCEVNTNSGTSAATLRYHYNTACTLPTTSLTQTGFAATTSWATANTIGATAVATIAKSTAAPTVTTYYARKTGCAANYYKSSTTACSTCASLTTGGFYNTSAAGTASDATVCKGTTSSGKYVATANADETACSGGYCPGNVTVAYGSTGGRSTLTNWTCPSSASAATQCYRSVTLNRNGMTTGTLALPSSHGCKSLTNTNTSSSVVEIYYNTTCKLPATAISATATGTTYTGTGSWATSANATSGFVTELKLTSTSSSLTYYAGKTYKCAAGYYLKASTNGACSACEDGYYCPAMSSAVYYSTSVQGRNACTANAGTLFTHSNKSTVDSTTRNAVDDCYATITAKKYIAATSSTSETTCTKGYYCPGGNYYYTSGGTNFGRTQCPANSYCVAGVSAATACSTLGGGLYTKSAAGSDADTDCYITTTAGSYLAASTDTTQTTCPGFYYCPATNVYYPNVGATDNADTVVDGVYNCPAISSTTTMTSSEYPDWFYNVSSVTPTSYNGTGVKAKTSCRIYYTVVNERGTQTTLFYFNSTSGKYNTYNQKYYTKYNPGYYGSDYYSSSAYCDVATRRMYHQDAQPCPAGSYCPGLTSIPYCNNTDYTWAETIGIYDCPTAYPNSAAQSSKIGQCYLTTSSTKYVATAGAGQVTCACGGYCPGGTKVYYNTDGGAATGGRTACGSGKYNASTGSSASSACSTAAAGYYANSSCSATICPAGTYAAAGAASCSNINAGYYSTGGGTSATPTANGNGCTGSGNTCGKISSGYYCSVGAKKATPASASDSVSSSASCGACPSATTYKRTTFPDNYYASQIDSTSISGGAGATAITQCRVLSWISGPRGTLYEYATYNTTTNKYDTSNSYGWSDVNAGYYLTTKGACGSYAYYKDANVCPAGSYCPGKTHVACDSSNQATVHTTNFGLESCPANSYCVAGVSAATACSTLGGGLYTKSNAGSDAATDCYITTTAGKYLAASTDTAQTACPSYFYCPSTNVYYPNAGATDNADTVVDGIYNCPAANDTTKRGTPYPSNWYTVSSVNAFVLNSTKNIQAKTGCNAYYQVVNERGRVRLYYYFNESTGKYDGSEMARYYDQFKAGYYGSARYYADSVCNSAITGSTKMIYKDAEPCPAGSFCPALTSMPTCKDHTYETTMNKYECATGSYSAATSGTCTACPGGRTTSGAGTAYNTNANTTCSVTCSSIANLATWVTPSWSSSGTTPNVTNSVSGLCTVDTCAAGAYKSGNTCPVCSGDKYSSAGATSCLSCLTNYHITGTAITNHDSITDCQISCNGGYYIKNANDTTCTAVGVGKWATPSTVAQGSAGSVNSCPTGLTTIGYGTGADSAGDCGRKFHAADGMLYLRSTKRTTPSLNIKIDGVTYYGNMSTVERNMSAGTTRKLKVRTNDKTYHVYDDSVGGESEVPSEYTPVDYIQSSGSSYIDTGYKLTSNNVVYEWDAVDNAASGNTSLFGTQGTQDGGTRYSGILHGNKTSRPLWAGSTGSLAVGYVSNDTSFHTWKLDLNTSSATLIKDSTVVGTKAFSGNLYKGQNVFLFSNASNGSATQATQVAMKYFRIIDNNKIVFNGIPVKRNSDNVCGMYDTVTKTFFGSASSTAFTCP